MTVRLGDLLLAVRERQHLVQQPYVLPLQQVHVVQHDDRLPRAPLDSPAQVLVEPRLGLQGRRAGRHTKVHATALFKYGTKISMEG